MSMILSCLNSNNLNLLAGGKYQNVKIHEANNWRAEQS